MGIIGPRGWCGVGLLMFIGLRFSSLAGVVQLTVGLGKTVTPTVEVRTLGSEFEGYTKGSLTRIRWSQGTSWLVWGGPYHVC